MNILFAGTPIFSAEILKHLIDEKHQIMGVLTQPDRKQGRGLKLSPSAVKKIALEKFNDIGNNAAIWQLEHFNEEKVSLENKRHLQEFRAWIEKMIKEKKIDVCVVVAYGLIIPKWFLELLPCVNIHASLLPRWRGAAPIHRAIEAGDSKTGVQIMKMEEGLDTGAILYGEEMMITEYHHTLSLHDDLIESGKRCISKVLSSESFKNFDNLWNNAQIQSTEGITYATKIDKSEYQLDFINNDAMSLSRKIRAFYPYAFIEGYGWCEKRLKILEADVCRDEKIGLNNDDLLKQGIFRCHNETWIQLKKVQKAGGIPILWHEFYNNQ